MAAAAPRRGGRRIYTTTASFYKKFDLSGKIMVINSIEKPLEEKMMNEPIHVTDAAFDKVVLQASVPVIVDFWAPWCGPCKIIAPALEKLAKENEGKMLVAKVNTDENPEWAEKYGVQGIPTILFVSNGKILHRQTGALPEGMLREVVSQFLKVAGTSSN